MVLVSDLIANQAESTPDAIALEQQGVKLSYAQLNARVNQLAHFLRARGVGPEVLTGLCMRRSLEMVVAMLGVLKAGGAYVPIDPNDPAERQSFQLQDSAVRILITTDALAKTLPVNGGTAICMDSGWRAIAGESETNPAPVSGPENPAYVIYTSGSTGRPKGVIVTHAGLANYLLWALRAYGNEARRSALVHSSVSFDLTITGLYTPLLVGGRVELVPDDAGVDGLVEALRQPQTRGLVKITPAHLDLLSHCLRPEEVAGKVELFVIGGENLLGESLRFWREASPKTRFVNEYGPTETVVGCCVYEVRSDDPFSGSVPIGRAIDNTQLYVLDPQLGPVNPGNIGELYIGGAGVARGYLNRPELTREHFLEDPFSAGAGARMYKTGDSARCLGDGMFEYVGRLDEQLKIRGYRVELGEIESVMAEHAAVRQCVVMAREDEPGNKQLAAYVLAREGQKASPQELREFLRRKLPEYMVPAHFVVLDAFPLTPNGKVDRAALPVPEKTLSRRELIPPRNAVEFRLMAIWSELLGVGSLSVTDDFFDLGGHSLLVAKLLVKVEKLFGKKLSMATLFEAPTISQLAAVLESGIHAKSIVIPVQPLGHLPPLFCIGAGPLFRTLALRLGTTRPFLGLAASQLPALKHSSTPIDLPQIAGQLVMSILDYQKNGPYFLGGWSASGVVAYETARQLIEKGHDVDLLVMFDTANPEFRRRVSKEARLERWSNKLKFLAKKISDLKLNDAPAFLAEKLHEIRRRMGVSAWQLQEKIRRRMKRPNLQDTDQVVYAAVGSYRPPPYTGRVVFFKPAERPHGNAWDLSRGWHQLVKGDFEVHEIPGDHRSMFLEPHVEMLAGIMMKYWV